MHARLPILVALMLAACSEPDRQPVGRIELGEAVPVQETPLPSPDTSAAVWQERPGGGVLSFADPGGAAHLSLACLRDRAAPRVVLIRHASAHAGQGALFPVLGNGERSRFPVDAVRAGGEWRWQATLAADDPRLAVFEGEGEITATLPGKGTLAISGSAAPGEFLRRCREGAAAPAPALP